MISSRPGHPGGRAFVGALALGLLLITADPADAYIGPGAGFALISSFFVFLTTVIVAGLSLLVWPLRMAVGLLRHKRHGPPLIGRLVIVGLDGQDPRLTERFLQAGKLPNFRRLAEMGGYSRLRTTYPSVSPVAWSSFSTGTNPARHNIFDFLDRDRRTYLPVLSSARLRGAESFVRLGPLRLPLRRARFQLLRKSRSFWSVLGEHGIWSTILRVPTTFPPERFHGAQLSAMAVPDIRGTQGTFTFYTTRPAAESPNDAGVRIQVDVEHDQISSSLRGPENPLRQGAALEVPVRVRLDRAVRRAHVELDGQRLTLEPHHMSGWITVRFRAAPGLTVCGICRLLLTEMDEHVSLYVTPINIDPDRPAMPISHPSFYATYLSMRIGKFATLGLAEDTSALNEGVISDEDFLRQAYDVDREREAMLFAALDRLRAGVLVSVFDGTDRIQHMFWHEIDDRHPVHRPAPNGDPNAIERLYAHNDALIGRVMDRLRPNDILLVLSDHGFASFRREMNLNGWLLREGYLALKPGTDGTRQWLLDVDWTRTRAYALGLSGLFLNLEGRESAGVVKRGPEAAALKRELRTRLSGLADREGHDVGIVEAFDTSTLYSGPYLENAPDLIVGYNAGYRHSWDSVTGIVAGPIFRDNTRAWSGDHCIDPRLVPGVLFSSRPIDARDPALIDIAPTVLGLFGVEPPGYMEGTPLFDFERPHRASA